MCAALHQHRFRHRLQHYSISWISGTDNKLHHLDILHLLSTPDESATAAFSLQVRTHDGSNHEWAEFGIPGGHLHLLLLPTYSQSTAGGDELGLCRLQWGTTAGSGVLPAQSEA